MSEKRYTRVSKSVPLLSIVLPNVTEDSRRSYSRIFEFVQTYFNMINSTVNRIKREIEDSNAKKRRREQQRVHRLEEQHSKLRVLFVGSQQVVRAAEVDEETFKYVQFKHEKLEALATSLNLVGKIVGSKAEEGPKRRKVPPNQPHTFEFLKPQENLQFRTLLKKNSSLNSINHENMQQFEALQEFLSSEFPLIVNFLRKIEDYAASFIQLEKSNRRFYRPETSKAKIIKRVLYEILLKNSFSYIQFSSHLVFVERLEKKVKEYFSNRVDMQLVNLSQAFGFYRLFMLFEAKEEAFILVTKAFYQNFNAVQCLLTLETKYLLQFPLLFQAEAGTPPARSDPRIMTPKIIGSLSYDLFHFKSRVPLALNCLQKLSEIFSVADLKELLRTVGTQALELGEYLTAADYFQKLLFILENIDIPKKFVFDKEYKAQLKDRRSRMTKIQAFLNVSREYFTLLNNLVFLSLKLKRPEQCLIFITQAAFIYKNSIKMIDYTDPNKYDKKNPGLKILQDYDDHQRELEEKTLFTEHFRFFKDNFSTLSEYHQDLKKTQAENRAVRDILCNIDRLKKFEFADYRSLMSEVLPKHMEFRYAFDFDSDDKTLIYPCYIGIFNESDWGIVNSNKINEWKQNRADHNKSNTASFIRPGKDVRDIKDIKAMKANGAYKLTPSILAEFYHASNDRPELLDILFRTEFARLGTARPPPLDPAATHARLVRKHFERDLSARTPAEETSERHSIQLSPRLEPEYLSLRPEGRQALYGSRLMVFLRQKLGKRPAASIFARETRACTVRVVGEFNIGVMGGPMVGLAALDEMIVRDRICARGQDDENHSDAESDQGLLLKSTKEIFPLRRFLKTPHTPLAAASDAFVASRLHVAGVWAGGTGGPNRFMSGMRGAKWMNRGNSDRRGLSAGMRGVRGSSANDRRVLSSGYPSPASTPSDRKGAASPMPDVPAPAAKYIDPIQSLSLIQRERFTSFAYIWQGKQKFDLEFGLQRDKRLADPGSIYLILTFRSETNHLWNRSVGLYFPLTVPLEAIYESMLFRCKFNTIIPIFHKHISETYLEALAQKPHELEDFLDAPMRERLDRELVSVGLTKSLLFVNFGEPALSGLTPPCVFTALDWNSLLSFVALVQFLVPFLRLARREGRNKIDFSKLLRRAAGGLKAARVAFLLAEKVYEKEAKKVVQGRIEQRVPALRGGSVSLSSQPVASLRRGATFDNGNLPSLRKGGTVEFVGREYLYSPSLTVNGRGGLADFGGNFLAEFSFLLRLMQTGLECRALAREGSEGFEAEEWVSGRVIKAKSRFVFVELRVRVDTAELEGLRGRLKQAPEFLLNWLETCRLQHAEFYAAARAYTLWRGLARVLSFKLTHRLPATAFTYQPAKPSLGSARRSLDPSTLGPAAQSAEISLIEALRAGMFGPGGAGELLGSRAGELSLFLVSMALMPFETRQYEALFGGSLLDQGALAKLTVFLTHLHGSEKVMLPVFDIEAFRRALRFDVRDLDEMMMKQFSKHLFSAHSRIQYLKHYHRLLELLGDPPSSSLPFRAIAHNHSMFNHSTAQALNTSTTQRLNPSPLQPRPQPPEAVDPAEADDEEPRRTRAVSRDRFESAGSNSSVVRKLIEWETIDLQGPARSPGFIHIDASLLRPGGGLSVQVHLATSAAGEVSATAVEFHARGWSARRVVVNPLGSRRQRAELLHLAVRQLASIESERAHRDIQSQRANRGDPRGVAAGGAGLAPLIFGRRGAGGPTRVARVVQMELRRGRERVVNSVEVFCAAELIERGQLERLRAEAAELGVAGRLGFMGVSSFEEYFMLRVLVSESRRWRGVEGSSLGGPNGFTFILRRESSQIAFCRLQLVASGSDVDALMSRRPLSSFIRRILFHNSRGELMSPAMFLREFSGQLARLARPRGSPTYSRLEVAGLANHPAALRAAHAEGARFLQLSGEIFEVFLQKKVVKLAGRFALVTVFVGRLAQVVRVEVYVPQVRRRFSFDAKIELFREFVVEAVRKVIGDCGVENKADIARLSSTENRVDTQSLPDTITLPVDPSTTQLLSPSELQLPLNASTPQPLNASTSTEKRLSQLTLNRRKQSSAPKNLLINQLDSLLQNSEGINKLFLLRLMDLLRQKPRRFLKPLIRSLTRQLETQMPYPDLREAQSRIYPVDPGYPTGLVDPANLLTSQPLNPRAKTIDLLTSLPLNSSTAQPRYPRPAPIDLLSSQPLNPKKPKPPKPRPRVERETLVEAKIDTFLSLFKRHLGDSIISSISLPTTDLSTPQLCLNNLLFSGQELVFSQSILSEGRQIYKVDGFQGDETAELEKRAAPGSETAQTPCIFRPYENLSLPSINRKFIWLRIQALHINSFNHPKVLVKNLREIVSMKSEEDGVEVGFSKIVNLSYVAQISLFLCNAMFSSKLITFKFN